MEVHKVDSIKPKHYQSILIWKILLGGAVGNHNSPNASAELEGEESELVTIDAPTAPKRDLIALLKQTTAVPIDQTKITLKSFFISVDVERSTSVNHMADHIRELLQEYHGQDERMFLGY